jgi:hypothetical protein
MRIPRAILERILRGEVTLVFRRCIRPTVKTGETLRTERGGLRVGAVTRVEEREISDDDARRAGRPSRAELLHELHAGRPGWVYRIELRAESAAPRTRPSDGPAESRE